MKPREYDKLKREFVKEQKRWRSLKVGDIIYEAVPREIDFDYHKMIIDKINIEERKVVAHDVEGGHKATLSAFMTEHEFNKLR